MEPISHLAFQTTRWSLVDALRSDDETRARRAGEQLVQLYWPAVYAYLRRTGLDPEWAGEVAQGFFVDVVLHRRLFEIADRETGRVRSLLLAALRRYRVDVARRAKAHPDWDSPDPSRLAAIEQRTEPGDAPESSFEREWAIASLDEARRRCEEHFCSNGRSAHWAVFEARHIAPVSSGSEPPPLGQLAADHGFASPAAAAAAVQVVRKSFRAMLVGIMAEQNANDSEEEARLVLKTLAG
jgi:DNA-directed RNA polymerase specialized sigma24 family protein